MFQAPYQEWLDLLVSLCTEAGEEILRWYASDRASEHSNKADDTPLTQADLASHEILSRGLLPTGIPVLSEESTDLELRQRRSWPRCWMVDPLDGTKEFLARTGEFTINVALIDSSRPVFGVIAVPVEGSLYAAARGQGAWRFQDGNWQPVQARRLDEQSPLVVHTSRRHRGQTLESFLDKLSVHPAGVERDYAGSALKFCRMAEGRGDIYPRFSPCSEWDTAAGEILLEAAGGALRAPNGDAFHYNCRDSLLNGHFIAVADPHNKYFPI